MIKKQRIVLLVILLIKGFVLLFGMFHIAHDAVTFANLVGNTP